MTITLNLEDDLVQQLEERAREQGLSDASAYVHQMLREILGDQPRGQRAVERLRGTASPGATTDEVMDMTRGEG